MDIYSADLSNHNIRNANPGHYEHPSSGCEEEMNEVFYKYATRLNKF